MSRREPLRWTEPRWPEGVKRQWALSGFKALPAAEQKRHWSEVLGVPTSIGKDHQAILARARYRDLQKEHHPDRGGDPNRMREVQRAWSEAQEDLRA